jgi:hypothetical protein
MIAPSQYEWALGLFAYPDAPPQAHEFAQFYFILSELIQEIGLTITHIAAEGQGHSGKMVKIGATSAKRIIDSGFSDLSVLSLSICPAGSKEPAYDRQFSVNLAWSAPSELLLSLVCNEAVSVFQGPWFEKMLKALLNMRSWAFGFAFKDKVERQPEFHVLALDNGRLTNEESISLNRWYSSSANDRLIKIRSVYPVTIINDQQLRCAANESTLGDFIRAASDTKTEKIGGLVVWRVPENRVLALQNALKKNNGVIA